MTPVTHFASFESLSALISKGSAGQNGPAVPGGRRATSLARRLLTQLGSNATQATNRFVAHVSQFRGARADMRNFVLHHLLPALGRLMNCSDVIEPRPLTISLAMPGSI